MCRIHQYSLILFEKNNCCWRCKISCLNSVRNLKIIQSQIQILSFSICFRCLEARSCGSGGAWQACQTWSRYNTPWTWRPIPARSATAAARTFAWWRLPRALAAHVRTTWCWGKAACLVKIRPPALQNTSHAGKANKKVFFFCILWPFQTQICKPLFNWGILEGKKKNYANWRKYLRMSFDKVKFISIGIIFTYKSYGNVKTKIS